MALQNHPAMYTGGAVRFDSTPYTNFAINFEQRRKAKDEALDNYYQNLAKGINPAGVRTVDIDGFMKRTGELQNFWQQNRDAVKNPRLDGGKAQSELMSRYQDAISYIQRSKNEEAAKKPLLPVLADPEKRKLVPNSVIRKLQIHDMPLDADGRQSMSISELDFDPKPLDQTKYFKSFSDIKPQKQGVNITTDGKTMSKIVTTRLAFDDVAKDAIYGRASGLYNSDASFEKFVNDNWQDEGSFNELNEIFKKNFGENIENQEDWAAAYTIRGLQSEGQDMQVTGDSFGQAKAMAAINDGYIRGRMKLADTYAKGRMDYKLTKTKQQQEGVLNNFIKTQLKDAEGDNRNVTVNGVRYEGKEVKMPKFMTDKYVAWDEKDQPIYPKWIITNDLKYAVPYFTTGAKTKSGNPVIDGANTKPILIESYKADLAKEWLTRSATGEEISDDFDEEEGDVIETTTVEATRTNESGSTQKPVKPTKPSKKGILD
jgi:hypothetical protein